MGIINRQRFFEITKQFEYVPFTQSYGWFSFFYADENEGFVFLIDDEANPQIACFGHVKKALGLKMLMVEGECLKSKTYKSSEIKSFYETFPSLGYDMVEVVSNAPYNSEFEIGIRRAGFLRPVGSFSMPLSNWIHLQDEITFNSNWTRNAKKALDAKLKFELFETPCPDFIKSIVHFYNQFSIEKGFAHQLDVAAMQRLLQSDNFSLGIVTNQDNAIQSCIIYHHNAKHAGLLYAAKSEEAKENGATFFMYHSLFEALKNQGHETFDMEKLVPSTHSTDGVFLFKDGVKGERVVYNGEWSWYKKGIYRPMMYFVKRWVFKKREI